MNLSKRVVRAAPSPSGNLHLGTARTTYYNYLEAHSSGGKFILRIDDTDKERNKEEYIKVIFDSLEWLSLEPDEIHYQSRRGEIYSKAAQALLERGLAFQATNGAIILKCPPALPQSFTDTVSGTIPITDTNRKQIEGEHGGLVIVRGDGNPIYHFTSVVDDYELGIDHIIRGTDHLTNTPKQIVLWNSLEPTPKPLPLFSHVGLIFKDKKKLSKRDGAASLLSYRDAGYKPEAILDWILRMGWGLKVERGASKDEQRAASRFLSKDEAISLWLKGTLKASPCSFDLDKLNSINKRL